MKYFIVVLFLVMTIFFGGATVLAVENTIMPGTVNQPSAESQEGFTPAKCATAIQNGEITDPAQKQYCGAYEMNDFILLIDKVIKFFFGIVGSLVLVTFFWGGVLYMTSAAVDNIDRAKKMMWGAFMGLVIIFVSYSIVEFMINRVFSSEWAGERKWESGEVTK